MDRTTQEEPQTTPEQTEIPLCVLEVDAETNRPEVEVHAALVRSMKPHQFEGAKFLYKTMIESTKEVSEGKPGGGAILAHCMGLGKTFVTVCFLHTLLTHKILKTYIRKVIVFCPCNVLLNWAREFEGWIDKNPEIGEKIKIFEFRRVKSVVDRMKMLEDWNEQGGVLIMSYSIFRIMTQAKMKANPEFEKRLPQLLHDPGADLVVCDEGHTLKSSKAQISRAMNLIRTRRRLILTGTPLQNRMSEYHCMVNFVRPDSLGTSKEFDKRFVKPITLGQEADASQRAVRLMKTKVHILNKLLAGCVHRCDYSHLAPYLPPKYEYVILIHLSKLQVKLYRQYLKSIGITRDTTREQLKGCYFLRDYQALKMVWSHPYLLAESAERRERRRRKKPNPSGDFERYASSADSLCDEDDSVSSNPRNGGSDDRVVTRSYGARRNRRGGRVVDSDSQDEITELTPEMPWWSKHVPQEEEEFTSLELSSKLVVAFEILRECERVKDKAIVFSTSLLTLDFFERLLQTDCAKRPEETVRNKTTGLGKWKCGADYFRIDGSTGVRMRKMCIDKFNDRNNEKARLILVSTKAGGIGTNMIGANRVIVIDTSWNPSDDAQAVFRAYRFGQTKPVYVYRLLSHATMEEKIYSRQLDKIALASRVVDEKNLERHFNEADLKALYEFKPERKSRKTLPLPKDRLLAELLITCKKLIKGYHDHDALLRKDLENELTEADRKQAWMDYENERRAGLHGGDIPSMSAERFTLPTDFYDFQRQLKVSYRQAVMTQNSGDMLRDSMPYLPPSMSPKEIFKQISLKYPNAEQLAVAMRFKHAIVVAENSRASGASRAKRPARSRSKPKATKSRTTPSVTRERKRQ